MLRNSLFAVVFVSAYLAIYYIFFLAGYDDVVTFMFLLSPILVVWMVITVLKHGKHTGRELQQHEEWGYEDKSREEF